MPQLHLSWYGGNNNKYNEMKDIFIHNLAFTTANLEKDGLKKGGGRG